MTWWPWRGGRYGSIVLAKMDATANDSPVAGLQARGYPTIKFIKAGDNKVRSPSTPGQTPNLKPKLEPLNPVAPRPC